ncbi:DUF6036 family nucleotidyltransferase [Tsukamurella hominis]|uniref:DUF6036 family nucleotidyltransferase n=1 Tax=Tsukamurella hominis TaxID=1970232 RepID=UPI0039E9542E
MNQDQLRLGIAAACQLTGEPYVVVVGSQAILGSHSHNELPATAVLSREMDVTLWTQFVQEATPDEIADKLTKVNVYLGEESGFDYEHGFYIEAIQRETVIFPAGWQDRLVRFECGIPGKAYGVSGFCLEPHDLCVSKALAGREKDWEFIRALVTAGVVQADVIHERITGTIEWPPHYEFDVSIAVERAASTILGF